MAHPTVRRQVLAWSFYDWANSAFATVVIAGFFPVFFKQFWAADLALTESTRWLGYTSSTASLILVCMAPLLGALADQLGAKKRFLLTFTAQDVAGLGASLGTAPPKRSAAYGYVDISIGNLFFHTTAAGLVLPPIIRPVPTQGPGFELAVAGNFDIEKQKKISKLHEKLQGLLNKQDMAGILKISNEILDEEPSDEIAINTQLFMNENNNEIY